MTSGKPEGPCPGDSLHCFLVFLDGVEDGSPLHQFITEHCFHHHRYTPAARILWSWRVRKEMKVWIDGG